MTELNVVKRLREIQKSLEELASKQVVVGAIGGDASEEGLTNADLLAIHEFGAVINHPGGTGYSKNSSGKAKFVSNSFIGPRSGVTGPHTIVIPERPVMRIALTKNIDQVEKLLSTRIAECLRGDISVEDAYSSVGNYLRVEIQDVFGSSDLKPLSNQTIKQKGSVEPLVDRGDLAGSISYEVRNRE